MKRIIKKTDIYKKYKYYLKLVQDGKNYPNEKWKVAYLEEHFDIKDMKPAKGYLRRIQEDTIKMASVFLNDVKDLKIHPFLIDDSLIGWYRHRGFLPWDDRIRFGLISEELENLVEYVKKNWLVATLDENSELECIDNIIKENYDKYTALIYDKKIQIVKAHNTIDLPIIEFFVFDRFDNNLKKTVIDHRNDIELDYNLMFPLKEETFEKQEIYVPNKPEEFLNVEKFDYVSYPTDFDNRDRIRWKKYNKKNRLTAEFYLIDAFEIAHFKPLYEYLRDKGIYAIFIAEPPEINVTNNWFDYENAIRILKDNQLEYDTECNSEADYAFTTQAIECLKKYKNIKINVSYGCALALDGKQFIYSKHTLDGFDYKLVHGPFTKELCRRILGEDWKKYKNRIYMMGYPRFTDALNEHVDKEEIKNELGIITDKAIIGYLPTWGDYSDIEQYYRAIIELKKEFFVISKPHHCTARLESEENNLKMLREESDYLLPPEYDTIKFLEICDVVIANAKSGVSLECTWLKEDAKLVFITNEYSDRDFCPEIKEIVELVDSYEILVDTVKRVIKDDKYIGRRIAFVENVFGKKNNNYLEVIYKEIFAERNKTYGK